MNDSIIRLQEDVRKDKALREKLLQTEHSSDPMAEFCKCSTESGYPITVGELFSMGEDCRDSMLRSVNGGGVEAPDGWGDMYENIMAELKKIAMGK